MKPEIKIFQSVEELNAFARNEIARIAADSIRERGVFTIALSGGSTPKKLYELLVAAADFQGEIDWKKTHFFFGDERFVAPHAEESNFRMAHETLFSKIEVPSENIHRFLTEKTDAQNVAEEMENSLREFFRLARNEFPRFDLILLGMGADGHTASLFPKSEALKEKEKIVAANFVSKFDAFRLTFTFPTINNARNVIFLIAGEDKAEVLREVLHGVSNPLKFPSQFVRPTNGSLTFLIDSKASSLLDR